MTIFIYLVVLHLIFLTAYNVYNYFFICRISFCFIISGYYAVMPSTTCRVQRISEQLQIIWIASFN